MKLINKIKFKVLTIFIIILLSNKLQSRALKTKNEITFKNKNEIKLYTKSTISKYYNLDCSKIHACQDAVTKFKKYLKDDEFLKKIIFDYFGFDEKQADEVMHKFFENDNLILKKNLNLLDDKKIIEIYKKDLLTIVDLNLNSKYFLKYLKDLIISDENRYLKYLKIRNKNRLNALLEIVKIVSEKLTSIKYTSLTSVKDNSESREFSLYVFDYDTVINKKTTINLPQPLIFTNSIKEKEDVPDKFFKNNIARVLLIKLKNFVFCNGFITEDEDIILEPNSYYRVNHLKKTEFNKKRGKESYQIFLKEIQISCLNFKPNYGHIIRTFYKNKLV